MVPIIHALLNDVSYAVQANPGRADVSLYRRPSSRYLSFPLIQPLIKQEKSLQEKIPTKTPLLLNKKRMKRAMAAASTSRTLINLSLSSTTTKFYSPFLKFPKKPIRVLLGFNCRPLCTITTTVTKTAISEPDEVKHSILLERLRLRHLKDSTKTPQAKTETQTPPKPAVAVESEEEHGGFRKSKKGKKIVGSFEELGLSEEVMGAVKEMEIEVPTEIQCIGIPAVLDGQNVVLGSHTGSGKTLAYMLPLVQVSFYLMFTLSIICFD